MKKKGTGFWCVWFESSKVSNHWNWWNRIKLLPRLEITGQNSGCMYTRDIGTDKRMWIVVKLWTPISICIIQVCIETPHEMCGR